MVLVEFFYEWAYDAIFWFFENIITLIFDLLYYIFYIPMYLLKWGAMAHDWGAYFLYHYEEYLISDFFTNYVWF